MKQVQVQCGATQLVSVSLNVNLRRNFVTPLYLPQLRFSLLFRPFADVSMVEHAWVEYVICTCESYRERRKTWEPFTARTVVISEKFVGKDESKKKEYTNIRTKSQSDRPVHTCSSLFSLSNEPSFLQTSYEETAVWWVRSAESSYQSWMKDLSPLVLFCWCIILPPRTHLPYRLTDPVFSEHQLDPLRGKTNS